MEFGLLPVAAIAIGSELKDLTEEVSSAGCSAAGSCLEVELDAQVAGCFHSWNLHT